MMKFGMIGLGKMGMNLVKNAVDHEIEVVAYDLNTKAVEEAKDYSDKITAVSTIENLLTELPASKIVWLMLPAGTPTNSTIEMLSEKLSAGDILIDGGNSNYKDNLEQNKLLTEKGIKFFDVGTSGGMAGARQGGNFMIGGDDEKSWTIIEPIFKAISMEEGYLYTGKLGSNLFCSI